MLILLLIFLILGIAILVKILSSQVKKPTTKIIGTEILLTEIPTVAPTFTPTPTATPSPKPTKPKPTLTPTPSPTPRPTIILQKDLDELFTKYSNEYNVDKELLKKIANCESTLNPNASTNKYAGLFQFAEPIWIQTRNLMGQNSDINLRFNTEESIKTAAFLISRRRFDIWPNCN
ncbi:MAG: transglycosylase SLT domain-containing protein [Candidatus Shapirobacteria bacterium]|nr:transglycosylase SLT domain-containing protein [Candidatus Shapirobacteria bacterium]